VTAFFLHGVRHRRDRLQFKLVGGGLLAFAPNVVGECSQTAWCGPHRIACADATDPEALHRVMGEGEVARLVLTDEPYNGIVKANEYRPFSASKLAARGGNS
jgi:hypothetical protein